MLYLDITHASVGKIARIDHAAGNVIAVTDCDLSYEFMRN